MQHCKATVERQTNKYSTETFLVSSNGWRRKTFPLFCYSVCSQLDKYSHFNWFEMQACAACTLDCRRMYVTTHQWRIGRTHVVPFGENAGRKKLYYELRQTLTLFDWFSRPSLSPQVVVLASRDGRRIFDAIATTTATAASTLYNDKSHCRINAFPNHMYLMQIIEMAFTSHMSHVLWQP